MSLPFVPPDTAPEAALVQAAAFQRMSPERRLEIALQMSEDLRQLSAIGVRGRHPEYTDDQVRLAVIRLWLGDDLFHEVYPGVDVQP